MVQRYLLYIAIISTPFFMSLKVTAFGGLGAQASFYPLFLGVLLFGMNGLVFKKKMFLPMNKSFFLLVLFVLTAFFSGIFNMDSLMELHFQGTTGDQRFFLQFGALIFYAISALYAYNVSLDLERDPLYILERLLLLSFFIPALYSSLELIAILGDASVMELLREIDTLFRPEDKIGVYPRVRSVTAEASYFGMYSAIIFPWLCSAVFDVKGWKKYIAVMIFIYYIVLNIFSFSRTSYMIFAIELILFMIFFRVSLLQHWKRVLGILVTGSLILCGIVDFFGDMVELDLGKVYLSLVADNGVYDMSNIARYGSGLAALNLWRDFPLLGCGFGGFGFYAADYYPAWAWISPELAIWAANTPGGAWPPVHNIYTRILSEMGIVGFVTWIMIGVLLLEEEWNLLLLNVDHHRVKNLMISTVGVFLCGFNVDMLHLLIYWMILGMVWSYRGRFCKAQVLEEKLRC